MQPYERYAVVALLLLVVVAVVGFFWDDGSDKKPEAAERDSVAMLDESGRAVPASSERNRDSTSGGTSGAMPISGRDDVAGDVNRATTRRMSAEHGVDPIRRETSSDGVEARTPPRVQDPAELRDLPRTVSPSGRGDDDGRLAIREASFTTRNRPTGAAREGGPTRSPSSERPVDTSAPTGSPTGSDPTGSTTSRSTTSRMAPAVPSRTYIVKDGDALSRIARDELGDEGRWIEIAALNGIPKPYTILQDMELILPSSDAAPARAEASQGGASVASGGPLDAGQRRYVMGKGETISAVLERELGTYRRSIALVVQLNPGLDPDNVRAGQPIVLPDPAQIPAAPAGAARGRRDDGPSLTSSRRGERVAAADSDSEFVVR